MKEASRHLSTATRKIEWDLAGDLNLYKDNWDMYRHSNRRTETVLEDYKYENIKRVLKKLSY